MNPLRTVFVKEVRDNLRDRRTLLSALLMGPLFGPILFAGVINLSLKQSLSDDSEPLDVPVIGQEHASNLIAFLKSSNINITAAPADRTAAVEAVKTGEHDLVLVIPGTFGEQLADTIPAMVEVISDLANTQAQRQSRRAVRALRSYNQQLAAMRLVARGVSPEVLRPLNIDVVDVSTPSGRSALLLGMLSYFFVFALLTGGMNLAIDSTAGERERGSLEPLLCLPVHGRVTRLKPGFVPCDAEVRTARTAGHDAELRAACGGESVSAVRAVYSARRFADDSRGVVHEELQGSPNLA